MGERHSEHTRRKTHGNQFISNTSHPAEDFSQASHRLRQRFLASLLLSVPAAAQAGDYTYYTTNNGTVTITRYIGFGGDVTIPSMIEDMPVASVGDWAFYDCAHLTGITIPDSVTSIGANAFYSCSGLTTITVNSLNATYSSVDGVLFNKNQTTLIQYPLGKLGNTFTIPNNVISIGDDAFTYCTGLTSIAIPSSVTSIGDNAFSYCTSLTSITIPDSVTTIGDQAFSSCLGRR